MKNRVVITGMGVISSLGCELSRFWSNIQAGQNGITRLTRFDTELLPTKVAATVDDFEPTEYMHAKEARRMDRYAQFALAAAMQAVQHAKLDVSDVDRKKMGIITGTGVGGIYSFEQQHVVFMEKGFKRVSPFLANMMLADSAPAVIAMRFGINGINQSVVNSCASSTNAIGDAFRAIKNGYADVVFTGGSEAAITPMSFAAFCAAGRAMSVTEDPDCASRPFDKNRDGFVMGEGAGILILESLQHAQQRNAPIICEIIGYGSSCDAYHMTAPEPSGKGFVSCMQDAMQEAEIDRSMIDYINAHGTSTSLNDRIESSAIRQVFGQYADNIAVSSTKSMTGHYLGAAGSIECIITALAIHDGFIPPTIHYETEDPECNLNDYVPNVGRTSNVTTAMTNGFGFGGHNAALVLRKIM